MIAVVIEIINELKRDSKNFALIKDMWNPLFTKLNITQSIGEKRNIEKNTINKQSIMLMILYSLWGWIKLISSTSKKLEPFNL